MEWVICDSCGKKFKRKRSQIKLAVKHYCSISCAEKGRIKGKMVECFNCKKLVYKSLKDLNLSKSGNYFCGRNCSNIWIGKQQRTENNPNWAGGKSSYKVLLKRTGIKQVCFLCGEENLKMLAVHHLDKNRKNNSTSNLVWLCHNCHFLVHHYELEKNKLFQKLNGKKV